jgi:hypothetical protein
MYSIFFIGKFIISPMKKPARYGPGGMAPSGFAWPFPPLLVCTFIILPAIVFLQRGKIPIFAAR